MECPDCGTRSDGNFCPSCGAGLRASSDCASCGAKLVPGARFCTRCGTAAGAVPRARSGSGDRSNLPWYIGGAVLLIAAVALAVPLLIDSAPEAAGPPVQDAPFDGSGGTGGTPPPLTGTPREQADRLYNRVMTAWANSDTAEARRFTPMAIAAYDRAQPLDNDGFYHLAMVQNVAGDHATALSTAERILAGNPDHLLALAAAIEATLPTDANAARSYALRFLDAYDTQRARTDVPEYVDHDRVLPDYQDMARAIIAR